MPVTRATRGIALMLLAMLAFASNDTFMKMLLSTCLCPRLWWCVGCLRS